MRLLVAIAIVVVIAGIVFLLARRSQPPVVLLPSPNGYDDFRQAGLLVSYCDPTIEDTATLQAEVEQNAKSLELVRVGLTKESRVPVEYSQTYAANLMSALSAFKTIASAFQAGGKLAEKEG